MRAGKSYTLFAHQADRWQGVLDRCGMYDVYHLPEYHLVAEEQGEGQAHLFVFEVDDILVAMPLLLRRCAEVAGLEESTHVDATSVYGYPGPIASESDISASIAKGFLRSYQSYLKRNAVVSAFSRLHPLMNQDSLLSSAGDLIDIGPTVAIDLTLPEQAQWEQYRNNHKRDIESAREKGIVCICDERWTYLDDFIDVYHENMQRVAADDYYLFNRSYFAQLRDLLGDHFRLFVALKGKSVIAGGLFTICGSMIQYHLGGTRTRCLDLSPIKLVFDQVRRWGMETGARIFHLGGGVGGKRDGLFHFKAGFSSETRQFGVWRAVVNQRIYEALTQQKHTWNQQRGLESIDKCYFPVYRARTGHALSTKN
jgi:hypothetical protein